MHTQLQQMKEGLLMLFEITNGTTLTPVQGTPTPVNHFESYFYPQSGTVMNSDIFGEDLLFLGRQISLGSKIFDSLAVDRLGRCVVLEVKTDKSYIASEMKALDYVSILRSFQGKDFLHTLTQNNQILMSAIENFVQDINTLNYSSRIILVASDFGKSVLSLSKWISEKNVSVQGIRYVPIQLEQKKYLSFSTAFNYSVSDEYADHLLNEIQNSERKPAYYWHVLNNGKSDQTWWDYSRKENFIALDYRNVQNEECPGFQKMNEYKNGDTVFVWAPGNGLVGAGKILGGYEFKAHHCKSQEGHYSHRRLVEWVAFTDRLEDAVTNTEINNYGIGLPTQGKQQIVQNLGNCEKMFEQLRSRMKPSLKRAS